MININFIYKNRTLLYTLNNILNCILVFKAVITNNLNIFAICLLIFAFNLYVYNKIDNRRLE